MYFFLLLYTKKIASIPSNIHEIIDIHIPVIKVFDLYSILILCFPSLIEIALYIRYNIEGIQEFRGTSIMQN